MDFAVEVGQAVGGVEVGGEAAVAAVGAQLAGAFFEAVVFGLQVGADGATVVDGRGGDLRKSGEGARQAVFGLRKVILVNKGIETV